MSIPQPLTTIWAVQCRDGTSDAEVLFFFVKRLPGLIVINFDGFAASFLLVKAKRLKANLRGLGCLCI